jgi:hypothetical protein
MNRRRFFAMLLSGVALGASAPVRLLAEGFTKLKKPLTEWRALLSPAAYDVLFEEATERPRSSALNNEKRPGTFVCAACNLPLFDAAAKYESGTGWPRFYEPIEGRRRTHRGRRHRAPGPRAYDPHPRLVSHRRSARRRGREHRHRAAAALLGFRQRTDVVLDAADNRRIRLENVQDLHQPWPCASATRTYASSVSAAVRDQENSQTRARQRTRRE